MELKAMTWNLFHGRDWPAEKELQIRKGRVSRKPVTGETHAQVNRDLWPEFTAAIAEQPWDVCLLQECPPRWLTGFERVCEAPGHRVFTSRNWFLPITAAIARIAPDLLGSSEGGSNQTLVHRDYEEIADRSTFLLTRRPERRAMAVTKLKNGLVIGNLHASTSPPLAEREILRGAAHLIEEAGEDGPVLLGGDFNVRPAKSDVFIELEREFGLTKATPGDAIDHLLVRNLSVEEPGHPLTPENRDVIDSKTGLKVRLSDHNQVLARFSGLR